MYVVPQDSKPFRDAPDVIMKGLNRMTWAGRRTVTDGSFKDFNELLALGYFEKQKIGVRHTSVAIPNAMWQVPDVIQYHDDGEDDLLGTIATMSIGGDAVMKLRMKDTWYSVNVKDIQKYDPTAEVVPGMEAWEKRLELNRLYGQVSQHNFDIAKAQFFQHVADERKKPKKGKGKEKTEKDKDKDSRSTSPVVITLKLKHGDITVMNGRKLQKYFEVCSLTIPLSSHPPFCLFPFIAKPKRKKTDTNPPKQQHTIIPDGKLRYAMTCRYVKPENIKKEDHWKAEFHIDAKDMYDGDPDLIQEVKGNMARLAAAAAAGAGVEDDRSSV